MTKQAAQQESATIDNETGDIINFEFPATIPLNPLASVESLVKKYSKLEKIDPDSKKEYKALKEAIKAVGDVRRDITKQEEAVKGPLNKLRTWLIAEAKKIRLPYENFENKLKAEQTRVDNIVADKLAAQKKVWEENLTLTRTWVDESMSMAASDLPVHLELLEGIALDEDDYGDLLPDAEQYRARAIQIAEEGIATEKERVRIAEESAKLEAEKKAMAEEKAKLEAEAAIVIINGYHAEALAMNETHDMRVKMAELEAAVIVPPITKADDKAVISSSAMEKISDSDFSKVMMGGGGGSGGKTSSQDQGIVTYKDIAQTVNASMAALSDFDDDETPLTDDEQDDFGNMNDFIEVLKSAAKVAPGNFHDARFNTAAARMLASLTNGCAYLQSIVDGDPA